MTYFPNVRDEQKACAYYEGNLNKENTMLLRGYDWAVEQVDITLANILDDYLDEKEGQELAEEIMEWMEMNRNEFVIAMMTEQEDFHDLIKKY